MDSPKWSLPANRLASGDRPVSARPKCKVCKAEIDPAANPCPYCGARNPLITLGLIAGVIIMLLFEAGMIVLMVRVWRGI